MLQTRNALFSECSRLAFLTAPYIVEALQAFRRWPVACEQFFVFLHPKQAVALLATRGSARVHLQPPSPGTVAWLTRQGTL